MPPEWPEKVINPKFSTDRLTTAYAHVGLFDAPANTMWIARKRFGVEPVRVSHARLILGGTHDTSTADKDKFVCFWFHTPGTGEGMVHGYPIEWSEGHVMIRLDPNWDYRNRVFIPNSDTPRVEKNIDQQYEWGKAIFRAYLELKPTFPLSYHMVGPRATDSMFYIERVEPK